MAKVSAKGAQIHRRNNLLPKGVTVESTLSSKVPARLSGEMISKFVRVISSRIYKSVNNFIYV